MVYLNKDVTYRMELNVKKTTLNIIVLVVLISETGSTYVFALCSSSSTYKSLHIFNIAIRYRSKHVSPIKLF